VLHLLAKIECKASFQFLYFFAFPYERFINLTKTLWVMTYSDVQVREKDLPGTEGSQKDFTLDVTIRTCSSPFSFMYKGKKIESSLPVHRDPAKQRHITMEIVKQEYGARFIRYEYYPNSFTRQRTRLWPYTEEKWQFRGRVFLK